MTEQKGLSFADIKRMVEQSADLTASARARSEQCRDYYDSKQWTSEEVSVLKKRKQPVLTINRIKRKVDSIVGIEQKGRVDPRALPRNPQDEGAADIATKALVYVDDITRFDALRSQFCYNLAIEGYGGVEVNVRQRNGQHDPDIIRLRWEEIFYDPYSRELDFSDASYTGVQKWMALDKAVSFAAGYSPETDRAVLEELLQNAMEGTGDTYEDRPRDEQPHAWGDKKKRRVKLAYMYYQHEGQWWLALICGGGEIYNQPSPFLDFTDDPQGVPSNAMVLQACYIDRENNRYGVVLDWLSVQDEVNKRRSKALHMLNARQTMGQRGAIADAKVMKRELAMPDGHVEYEQDPQSATPSFQIIPNADQMQGQFELLQESKGEIDMLGPNASLLGQLEGAQSGRAIIAQQQAGMAELAPFYDNLRDWTLRVYREMWNRIRQFWTEPKYIRITDELEGVQFLGLNGAPGPDGVPGMNVGALDVDIIIDMTPEYASLQMEEFQQLADLASSGNVPIPPDVLIEASQLRNKRKLLERLNDPQQAQQQMMAMQAQMAELTATIEKMTAEAQNKQADTAKKIAETEQIRQETAMAPAEFAQDMRDRQEQRGMDRARFGEEVRAGRAGEAREDRRFAEETRSSRVAEGREGVRQAEEMRSGRVGEAREGQRMAEEHRSGRVNEEMAREKQAADIEIARRKAANPAAGGK